MAAAVASFFTVIAAAQGDPRAGESISATCAACHGQDGNSVIAGTPHIAGQNERYLLRQLELIKSGERPAPLMAGQLDRLDTVQLANLAAYYASLAPTVRQSADENLDLGEAIYRGGLLDKGVAACSACHAPNGSGNALAGFPRISGQAIDYTVDQLTAYREQQRTSDEEYGGMMRDAAANLTDTEIRALANYVLGLH